MLAEGNDRSASQKPAHFQRMSIILYNLCNHELRVFRVKPSRDDENNRLAMRGSDVEKYYKYLGTKLQVVKRRCHGKGAIFSRFY